MNGAQWLPRGARALVAVSGGGDSVALLLALDALRAEFQWRLEVFHAHHGLRGEAADRASETVADLAAQLGLPLHRVDLRLSEGPRRANEERARAARAEAMRRTALEHGLTHAALAHTRDDLAETVLHRAVRGAGITGLAAMRPVSVWRGLTLVRPLLEETREGLRHFLSDHGVAWDEDETNAALSATRNRIRHLVRPLLAREINPRADEALARLALHAAEDDAQLEADVDAALASASIDLETALALPLDWLRRLSPSLRRRVLRRWFMALRRSPLPPSSRTVETVAAKITAPSAPPRWTAEGNLLLSVKRGTLRAQLPPSLETLRWPQLDADALPLTPGEPLPLGRGWRLESRLLSGEEARGQVAAALSPWTAVVDADRLVGDLRVRVRRPGDTFHPFGFDHAKPLRRFMSDARLPGCIRARLPLLTDAERVVWVIGQRIADPVRITPETRRGLWFRVVPPEP